MIKTLFAMLLPVVVSSVVVSSVAFADPPKSPVEVDHPVALAVAVHHAACQIDKHDHGNRFAAVDPARCR